MLAQSQLSPDIVYTPASPPISLPRTMYSPLHPRPPRSISLRSGQTTPRALSLQSRASRSSATSATSGVSGTSFASSAGSVGTWGGYSADVGSDEAPLDACFSPPSPPLQSSTTPYSSPDANVYDDEEEREEQAELMQAFLQLRATRTHASLFRSTLALDESEEEREKEGRRLTKGNLDALQYWDQACLPRRSDDEEEYPSRTYSPNPSTSCASEMTVFGTATPRYSKHGILGRGLDGIRMRGTSVCSKVGKQEVEEVEDVDDDASLYIASEELVQGDTVPVEALSVMIRWALGMLGVDLQRR